MSDRKSPEKRKQEVFGHIGRIIAEQGFSQVSTSTVAAAIGISQPALYRYFANRDEMIVGFLNHVRGMLMAVLEELDQVAGVRAKLEHFYRRQLELVEQNSLLPRLLFFEEFHLAPGLKQETLARIVEDFELGIGRIVEEGIARREIRHVDPRTAVAFIKGAILVFYLNWSLGGRRFSLSSRVDEIMAFLGQTLFP